MGLIKTVMVVMYAILMQTTTAMETQVVIPLILQIFSVMAITKPQL